MGRVAPARGLDRPGQAAYIGGAFPAAGVQTPHLPAPRPARQHRLDPPRPRPVGGYGLPQALRITIGTEDQNRAVIDALSEFAAG